MAVTGIPPALPEAARLCAINAGATAVAARTMAEATTVVGPISASSLRLGLKENWRQFALLLLVNAFVGAIVRLERRVS